MNELIRLVSTNDHYPALNSLASELNAMLRHYIRAKVILGGLSFAYAALLILGFSPRDSTGSSSGRSGIRSHCGLDDFSGHHR